MQGVDVTDGELLEYISESSTMSKAMDEYDGARGIIACPARAGPTRLSAPAIMPL